MISVFFLTALYGWEEEFIFERAPFAACHASTVVELKSGGLMAAWFGGSEEGTPDVAIWGSIKPRGGKWSVPVELAREEKVASYNPVLFYTRDNRLWLYYKFGLSPDRWSAARRYSTDDGKTWQKGEYLPAGLVGPVRSKPLVLGSGIIVAGSSVESYRTWAVWIERSLDNGRTWSKFGPVVPDETRAEPVEGAVPPQVYGSADWDRTKGIIEPSLVSLGGRKLRFYARSTSRIGRICVADSNDNGATWTHAHSIELPNPNSAVDGVTLRDGRIVLAYNASDKRRTPLVLAISKDGERFTQFATLESDPGEYSYPALIAGSDGALHVTYTWNRKRIKYVHITVPEIPR